jgi:hypothetical protein
LILKVLCRAHLETAGTFERFGYVVELKEYAKLHKLDLTDAFYELIGFKHDENVTAKNRANIRKLAVTKKPALKKLFETNDMHQVNDRLRRYECVPISVSKKNDYSEIEKHTDTIRVLSEYFKNSPDLVLNSGGKEITLGNFLKSLKSITKKADYLKFKESASAVNILNSMMPSIVVSDEVNYPTVYNGILYVKEEVQPELKSIFMSALLDHVCLSSLDVSESIYFRVIKSCLTYQTSEDTAYLELFDLANSMSSTIKEMFELCGIKYVDNLVVFQDTGCVLYLRGHDSYQVLSKNSQDSTNTVIMRAPEVEHYYKRGTLKTLFWEGLAPYVYDGSKIPVGSVI